MLHKTALVLSIAAALASPLAADEISFESGFADSQSVGSVATATNAVTFSISSAAGISSAYIAGAGAPGTAFNPNDASADPGRTGQYFLTDDHLSLSIAGSYRLQFLHPVTQLSLDTLDYRADGGALVGDQVVLTAFSDANFTNAFVQTQYAILGNEPDGVVHTLSLNLGSGSILSAILTVTHPDIGTGIDNITFTTLRPVPEPATLGLMAVGLLGLGAARRRRLGPARP